MECRPTFDGDAAASGLAGLRRGHGLMANRSKTRKRTPCCPRVTLPPAFSFLPCFPVPCSVASSLFLCQPFPIIPISDCFVEAAIHRHCPYSWLRGHLLFQAGPLRHLTPATTRTSRPPLNNFSTTESVVVLNFTNHLLLSRAGPLLILVSHHQDRLLPHPHPRPTSTPTPTPTHLFTGTSECVPH